MSKKHVVEVQVPTREGYQGYFSAQRHFAHGSKHKVEVNTKELRELQADSEAGRVMLNIVEEGDYSDEQKKGSDLSGLSPDERALIEAHRAKSNGSGKEVVRSPMNDSGVRAPGQPDVDTRADSEKQGDKHDERKGKK